MTDPHVDTARVNTRQPEADSLVLFGATGDLATRKLFPSLYRLEKSGALHVPVIGVARSECVCRHLARAEANPGPRGAPDVAAPTGDVRGGQPPAALKLVRPR